VDPERLDDGVNPGARVRLAGGHALLPSFFPRAAEQLEISMCPMTIALDATYRPSAVVGPKVLRAG
ncbi:MAG: hypothetical protein WEB67_00075, partial [Acidimicrobiia bacterium]